MELFNSTRCRLQFHVLGHALIFIALMAVLENSWLSGQVTSLTNNQVKYEVSQKHWVRISRGDVSVIIVDNAAIDVPELPKHRAGYSGLASLTHTKQKRNVFVPGIAGLNFEHIHDGTTQGLVEKFEPRKFPMELRIVDQYTVELYQAPTRNWKLESCGRYRLLGDGTIEYTFECIPRAKGFKNDFLGLFWASYIHQPEDKSIHFQGIKKGQTRRPAWVKGVTPEHGVKSTHPPIGGELPPIDHDFPLTLVNHPSEYEYAESWYYGVVRGMALVQMFRSQNRVWMAQSPSGGGNGNPAWDFQWFIDKPRIGKVYRLVMRMSYLPYENHTQITEATQGHRDALNATKQ